MNNISPAIKKIDLMLQASILGKYCPHYKATIETSEQGMLVTLGKFTHRFCFDSGQTFIEPADDVEHTDISNYILADHQKLRAVLHHEKLLPKN